MTTELFMLDTFNCSLSAEIVPLCSVCPFDLINIIYADTQNPLCNFIATCQRITGWPPTASSWTQKRPSYSGLGRGTVLRLSLAAVVCQFGTEVISASDHVRVLGVIISSDLSLDTHAANVCSSGFYWLCQLRRVTTPRHRIQDAHPCLRHVVCGLL